MFAAVCIYLYEHAFTIYYSRYLAGVYHLLPVGFWQLKAGTGTLGALDAGDAQGQNRQKPLQAPPNYESAEQNPLQMQAGEVQVAVPLPPQQYTKKQAAAQKIKATLENTLGIVNIILFLPIAFLQCPWRYGV